MTSSMMARVPAPLDPRLDPRLWPDLARAALELARARRDLGRRSGADLLRQGRRPVAPCPLSPTQAEALAARVAFAIPRVAARLPWRADCWVQALAAQAWLARAGVEGEVVIGVRQDRGGFEAHAWLRHGDRVVTGGEVAGYAPLVTPETPLP